MMASHMVASIRNEAGMVLGDNSKPVRCYTNNSESMNNVMRAAKETYLKGNPCVSQMNKFQFTKNVFEVVHAHQMEDLHSAIAGLSDVTSSRTMQVICKCQRISGSSGRQR